MNMKCDISRQRIDPVLAHDQFSVSQPLGPEDLDRHVMSMAFTLHSQTQLEFHGVST